MYYRLDNYDKWRKYVYKLDLINTDSLNSSFMYQSVKKKGVNHFFPTKIRKVHGINCGAFSHIRGADLGGFCLLVCMLTHIKKYYR
jgi:hypothetical protein